MEEEKSLDILDKWTTDLMPVAEGGRLIIAEKESLPSPRLSVTINIENAG